MTADILKRAGLPWLNTATDYLGTKEIPGEKSNPAILNWARRQTAWIASFYTNDDIPWCALFVNECLEANAIGGTQSLAARSFLKHGRRLDAPVIGCILVFGRAGGGHVGFYVGETATHYLVRGGNQDNQVKDSWIAQERLLDDGIRWPGTDAELARAQAIGRLWLTPDGRVASTDEA